MKATPGGMILSSRGVRKVPGRPPIPDDVRDAVIARDGLVCQLCGRDVVLGGDPTAPDAFNLDHVVQYAIGGPDTVENLRVTCAGCNGARPRPVPEPLRRSRSRRRAQAAERRAWREALGIPGRSSRA